MELWRVSALQAYSCYCGESKGIVATRETLSLGDLAPFHKKTSGRRSPLIIHLYFPLCALLVKRDWQWWRGNQLTSYSTESPGLRGVIDSDLWNAGHTTPITLLLSKIWPHSNMSITQNRREIKMSLFSNNVIVLVEKSRAFTYN